MVVSALTREIQNLNKNLQLSLERANASNSGLEQKLARHRKQNAKAIQANLQAFLSKTEHLIQENENIYAKQGEIHPLKIRVKELELEVKKAKVWRLARGLTRRTGCGCSK